MDQTPKFEHLAKKTDEVVGSTTDLVQELILRSQV